MQNGKLLTIAIPTYNRKEYLINCLKSIFIQYTDEIEIVVIDNSSDYNINQFLQTNLENLERYNIRIVRNVVNIGANANILRCFEFCATKWLYIIGDDDVLCYGMLKELLDDIVMYSSATCIHYKWYPENQWSNNRPLITVGLLQFLDKIESISKVLFISSNVYNTEKLKNHIQIGYQLITCNAAHLAVLISSLFNDSESIVVLSDKKIVKNGYYTLPEEKKWETYIFYRDIRLLLDLKLDRTSKMVLFSTILNSFPIKNILFSLLLKYSSDKDKHAFLADLEKAISYWRIYNKQMNKRFYLVTIRILFRNHLILNILSINILIIKKNIKKWNS